MLPFHVQEMERQDVVQNLIKVLKGVSYLRSIVVALGGTQEETAFQAVKNKFQPLQKGKTDLSVLWIESPPVQSLL